MPLEFNMTKEVSTQELTKARRTALLESHPDKVEHACTPAVLLDDIQRAWQFHRKHAMQNDVITQCSAPERAAWVEPCLRMQLRAATVQHSSSTRLDALTNQAPIFVELPAGFELAMADQ